jgi:ABC-2 type transport system permease protein
LTQYRIYRRLAVRAGIGMARVRVLPVARCLLPAVSIDYAEQVWTDIVWLTAQQLLTRAKMVILGLVAALPPLIAALVAISGADIDDRPRFLSGLCNLLVMVTVLPVVALVLGGGALGNEAEDGTITYLVMKPIPRWGIVAAKLLAALVIVAALVTTSVLVTTLIVSREPDLLRLGLAFAAGAAAGAVGYTTFFLFLGLITRHTLVFGLLYASIWEGVLTGLFPGLRLLSIRAYSLAITESLANASNDLLDARISTAAAVAGMAIVTLACFFLTTRRLEVMDIE